jgi:hypothetical protein
MKKPLLKNEKENEDNEYLEELSFAITPINTHNSNKNKCIGTQNFCNKIDEMKIKIEEIEIEDEILEQIFKEIDKIEEKNSEDTKNEKSNLITTQQIEENHHLFFPTQMFVNNTVKKENIFNKKKKLNDTLSSNTSSPLKIVKFQI